MNLDSINICKGSSGFSRHHGKQVAHGQNLDLQKGPSNVALKGCKSQDSLRVIVNGKADTTIASAIIDG